MIEECKNEICVSKEVLDFLTGIHADRENIEQRKVEMIDRAFNLAYKDMSTHTVAYKTAIKDKYFPDDSTRSNNNKINVKECIKKYTIDKIFGGSDLSELTKYLKDKKFDEWHKCACSRLAEIQNAGLTCELTDTGKGKVEMDLDISNVLIQNHSGKEVFSYGQAQKLINMMIKYLYIYYQCEGLSALDQLKEYAHAPIDRFVLKGAFGTEYYNGVPWSRIGTYEEYMACKSEIDDKAQEDGYPNGFQWEMAEWPFPGNK